MSVEIIFLLMFLISTDYLLFPRNILYLQSKTNTYKLKKIYLYFNILCTNKWLLSIYHVPDPMLLYKPEIQV